MSTATKPNVTASIERRIWTVEDAKAEFGAYAQVTADGHVQTPCQEPSCGERDYWSGYGQARQNRRQMVTQPDRGRRAMYCSNACKTAAYKARKAIEDKDRAQKERIMARLARENQAERVLRLVLADFVGNSRLSGPKADEIASEMVRMLNIHGMLS